MNVNFSFFVNKGYLFVGMYPKDLSPFNVDEVIR